MRKLSDLCFTLAAALAVFTAVVAQAQLFTPPPFLPAKAAPIVLPFDVSVTGTPVVGWATFKLRAAYAGNCMTFNRTSDSTTQAIGFVGNKCDQASAITFCGAANANGCELTTSQKWNDQSGNTNDCAPDQGGSHLPPPVFNAVNGLMAFDFSKGPAANGNSNCGVSSISNSTTALSLLVVTEECGSADAVMNTFDVSTFTSFMELQCDNTTNSAFANQHDASTLATGAKQSGLTFPGFHIVMGTFTNTSRFACVDGACSATNTTTLSMPTQNYINIGKAGGFASNVALAGLVWKNGTTGLSLADLQAECRSVASLTGITTSC